MTLQILCILSRIARVVFVFVTGVCLCVCVCLCLTKTWKQFERDHDDKVTMPREILSLSLGLSHRHTVCWPGGLGSSGWYKSVLHQKLMKFGRLKFYFSNHLISLAKIGMTTKSLTYLVNETVLNPAFTKTSKMPQWTIICIHHTNKLKQCLLCILTSIWGAAHPKCWKGKEQQICSKIWQKNGFFKLAPKYWSKVLFVLFPL